METPPTTWLTIRSAGVLAHVSSLPGDYGIGNLGPAARRFIAEKGYTFPVYFDFTGKAATDYGVMSIPTTFFIDGNGIVRAFHLGAMSREMIEEEIQGLLGE